MKTFLASYRLHIVILVITSIITASYIHAEHKDPSLAQKLGISALSGSATVTIVEPLVYIKNKLQQALREHLKQQKTSGTHATQKYAHISLNPRVMYRGVFVSAAGFGPNMALQSTGYHVVMNYAHDKPYKYVLAPIAAGCLSAPASALRELITIQQQNNGGTYSNAIRKVGSEHGYHNLIRGTKILAVRNSSFAGFLFMGAPYFSKKVNEYTENTTIRFFAPGIIAGAFSAALTQPLDTVKTNMQADITKKSAFQVTRELYTAIDPVTKKTGIRALYAGVYARMFTVGLSMALESNIRTRLTMWYDKKM
jgi:hypothetical protein